MAVIDGKEVNQLRGSGDLVVSVELNIEDDEAKTANKDKKQPRHYENISNQPFKNAVIVDAGSVIRFKIVSKGQFGYGYSIKGGERVDDQGLPVRDTQRGEIVKGLYCLDRSGKSSELTDVVRRYQVAAHNMERPLIKIDDFKALKIRSDQPGVALAQMGCEVKTWTVYGYVDGEDQVAYGHPLDIGEQRFGPPPKPMPKASARALAPSAAKVTAFGGAPAQFGTSTQEFTAADQIREDDPSKAPNYVNFSFLVERKT